MSGLRRALAAAAMAIAAAGGGLAAAAASAVPASAATQVPALGGTPGVTWSKPSPWGPRAVPAPA